MSGRRTGNCRADTAQLSYHCRRSLVAESGQKPDAANASATATPQARLSMKINSALVLQLRTARSWSQEELAIAAGLNPRTIQRIEKEATGSLQSKKALASVFEIDIKALEDKGTFVMTKHEYKSVNIALKRGFMSGLASAPLPNIEKVLNEEGKQGWRLVQILTPDALSSWGKSTENMVALFERPVPG